MNDDDEVIREITAISGGDEPSAILHYLYVPTDEAAEIVAKELQREGFEVEHRLGADGLAWLVLARHEAVPTKQMMAATRFAMEKLVAAFEGEYDGWEADVSRKVGIEPTRS